MENRVHNNDLCDFLNEGNNIGTKATIHYFEKHNFLYLKDRVKYEYSPDFGGIRPLRDVWIKLLDANSFEFVEFYENVYRFRKVPRYEDLFLTVIISIACNLASSELHDRYKIWRENNTNKKIYDKFTKSAELLFDYLMKIYALRESYLFGDISYEKFEEIKDYLKEKSFEGNLKELNLDMESKFTDLWNTFSQKHVSPTLVQAISELKEMIKFEYENPNPSSSDNQINKNPSLANSILLYGDSASPGFACGVAKIVNSVDDSKKILDGDIAIFDYFTSDMVGPLKRCAGAIGLPECGGLIGHLAIVSRELEIPCLVHCNYDKFYDGQVVYLDSNNREIRILLSIGEIKKYLQS
jgi:phosphohistidine swiveling domain-containing protein